MKKPGLSSTGESKDDPIVTRETSRCGFELRTEEYPGEDKKYFVNDVEVEHFQYRPNDGTLIIKEKLNGKHE
jgi:hypothetical protein